MTKVSTLPNIGKVIEGKLHKIGIDSAEEFLSRDPYIVFEELLRKVDPSLCRCALASIVGASKKEKWHIVMKEAVKTFEKKHPKYLWGPC